MVRQQFELLHHCSTYFAYPGVLGMIADARSFKSGFNFTVISCLCVTNEGSLFGEMGCRQQTAVVYAIGETPLYGISLPHSL